MSEPKRWKVTRYDGVAMAPSVRGRYVNGQDYDEVVRERDEARASAAQLAEALQRIEGIATTGSRLERIASEALAVFDAGSA